MITVFSKASLPMERGVGRIYSQSRGRGHRKFFWGLRPQTPSGSQLLSSPPNPKCAPRSLYRSEIRITPCIMIYGESISNYFPLPVLFFAFLVRPVFDLIGKQAVIDVFWKKGLLWIFDSFS